MKNKELIFFKSEHCLMCGDEIPEGRQVCQNCEKTVFESVSLGEKTCISPQKVKRKKSRFFNLFKKSDNKN